MLRRNLHLPSTRFSSLLASHQRKNILLSSSSFCISSLRFSSSSSTNNFFTFTHQPETRSFLVEFASSSASIISLQVPYIFLSDHSITFCDPDTLQRSIPVDFDRDQKEESSSKIRFDESKIFVDEKLRLVFFNRRMKKKAENSGDQNDFEEEWLAVPVESFFQLAAAREGQLRRDPAVSVEMFEQLMESFVFVGKKKDQNAQQESDNKNNNGENYIPQNVKDFVDSHDLDAVRTAAGLTSCHLRLAVANWLQHHQQVKTVVKEFNNNENNESEQIDFGNVSISALPEVTKLWRRGDIEQYFKNDNNGEQIQNSSTSKNEVTPRVSGIFPPALQEFIKKQENQDNFLNIINENNNSNSSSSSVSATLLQKEVEEILSQPSCVEHRAKIIARVAHAIEKFGFVIIEDPILELGLPSPLSLSTAEEPTGIPSSGMIADLLNNKEDPKSATKVVQRRNAVDLILKFLFGVLMNSFYGITPVWGNFKAKQKIDHLDTAYLTVGIDLHTDQTYSLHSPKLQGFGLIHEDKDLSRGGKNVLADGFAIAKFMSEKYPKEFTALTSNTVPAYYAKDGRFLSGYRPVFKTTKMYGNDSLGSISQVSFNAYDRAPAVVFDLPSSSTSTSTYMDKMNQFYHAYTLFGNLCHDRLKLQEEKEEENKVLEGEDNNKNNFSFEIQPKIGSLLIFDNHRCLHARTAFGGPRIMCGSYISLDDYFSALNQFQFQ